MTIAALNSFFISFKVVKYVQNFQRVEVFSKTLHTGSTRNIYFTLIIFMLLLGFALCYSVVFGRRIRKAHDLISAFLELFNWMIGDFEGVEEVLQYNPVAGGLFFIVFMVGFYFVNVNMFLATMLNTYGEEVGKRDIQTVKD